MGANDEPAADPEKKSEPETMDDALPPEKEEEEAPDASPPAESPKAPPPAQPAAWGAPIARFERRWTWIETRLITFVLISQILALVAWVFLTGLSTPVESGNAAGTVFRAIFGAGVLGTAGWVGARRLDAPRRRWITLAAVAVGVALAPLWRTVGVAYFDNVKAWLQEGSTLTLMGGLRGLGTRLTLWLALLGASLATSAGKHIHVDLLYRALPKRFRLPAALANYVAAAVVCSAAVWGFVDHLAIESFGARADQPAAAKVSRVAGHVGQHLFLARKQIVLDFKSLPHVLSGTRYDQWMTAPKWNAWVKGAGYEERYPGADLTNYLVPEGSPPHVPLVVSPDGEPARGILVHSLSLVFPFGLFMIALRFLLRAVLSVSGHLSVDPDEAHKEDLHGAGPASAAPSPQASKGGA